MSRADATSHQDSASRQEAGGLKTAATNSTAPDALKDWTISRKTDPCPRHAGL